MLCNRNKIKITMDKQTANDLYQLLYAQGEQIAAGAPIPPPLPDEAKRLALIFRDLEKKLKIDPFESYKRELTKRKKIEKFFRLFFRK